MRYVILILCTFFLAACAGFDAGDWIETPPPDAAPTDPQAPTPTQIVGTLEPDVTPVGPPDVLDPERPADWSATVTADRLIIRDVQGFDTGGRFFAGEQVSVWLPLRADVGGRAVEGNWCPIEPDYGRFVACLYLDPASLPQNR